MTGPTIEKLFDMTGKVALVTGGTGHLGSAIASALAEAGATVVISSRERARAEAAAGQLPRSGSTRHFGVEIDHMDENSVDQGFDEAVSAAGKLDILVNNGHEGDAHDLTNVTAEQFSRQLANAAGYFLLARRMRDPRGTEKRPSQHRLARVHVRSGRLVPRRLRRRLRRESRPLSHAQGRNRSHDPPLGGLLGQGRRARKLSKSRAVPHGQSSGRNGQAARRQKPDGTDGPAARTQRGLITLSQRSGQLHHRPKSRRRRRLDCLVERGP